MVKYEMFYDMSFTTICLFKHLVSQAFSLLMEALPADAELRLQQSKIGTPFFCLRMLTTLDFVNFTWCSGVWMPGSRHIARIEFGGVGFGANFYAFWGGDLNPETTPYIHPAKLKKWPRLQQSNVLWLQTTYNCDMFQLTLQTLLLVLWLEVPLVPLVVVVPVPLRQRPPASQTWRTLRTWWRPGQTSFTRRTWVASSRLRLLRLLEGAAVGWWTMDARTRHQLMCRSCSSSYRISKIRYVVVARCLPLKAPSAVRFALCGQVVFPQKALGPALYVGIKRRASCNMRTECLCISIYQLDHLCCIFSSKQCRWALYINRTFSPAFFFAP